MFLSGAAGVHKMNTVSVFRWLPGTGEEKMDFDKSVVFAYDGVPAHLDLAIPAPYVHISYINCKKHSIDCTNVLMFVLSILIHPKVVQECYWIAISVIKMLMKSVCTLMYVSLTLIQDSLNDFDVGVNESICFSFECPMTHMNAQKCYWMLIKMQKS